MNESEYRKRFQQCGDKLAKFAKAMRQGLIADDVGGIFLAIGISELSRDVSPIELAARLRDLADSIDPQRTLN